MVRITAFSPITRYQKWIHENILSTIVLANYITVAVTVTVAKWIAGPTEVVLRSRQSIVKNGHRLLSNRHQSNRLSSQLPLVRIRIIRSDRLQRPCRLTRDYYFLPPVNRIYLRIPDIQTVLNSGRKSPCCRPHQHCHPKNDLKHRGVLVELLVPENWTRVSNVYNYVHT